MTLLSCPVALFFLVFVLFFSWWKKKIFWAEKNPNHVQQSTRIEHCEKETKVGRFRFIFSCMLSHRMIFLCMCVNWLCFECDLVFPFLVSSH